MIHRVLENTLGSSVENQQLSENVQPHAQEISDRTRFEFGANWARFLSKLSDERILGAERSLIELFGSDDFAGKTFLDVGSGSGLFSLAARRLGATVHSLDYDPEAVNCTRKLKERFFPADVLWTIDEGSALDDNFLATLPRAELVYSWGVLHHTGAMWAAIDKVAKLAAQGGKLCLALYNDQGYKSRMWWHFKKWYNKLPRPLRPLYAALVYAPFDARLLLRYTFRGKPKQYFRDIRQYSSPRGMDWSSDRTDWIGGFPFEVCSTDDVTAFLEPRGFELIALKRAESLGCHEFVFLRSRDNGS